MKRTDLKAGEIYAVRRLGASLLLSTDVWQQSLHRMGPDAYKPAPGKNPWRDPSRFGDRTNYGFIMLGGDSKALTAADGPGILAYLETNGYSADSRHALPAGVWLNFVTSTVAIIGPYGEHVAYEKEKQEAEERRNEKLTAEYNAIVDALNRALRDEGAPIDRAYGNWAPPTEVRLSVAQTARLAAVLSPKEA